MRTTGHQSRRLLLRTLCGNGGKPGADEGVGRVASGVSGLWDAPTEGAPGTTGSASQSQATKAAHGDDGNPGHPPAWLVESTWGRARDLSVSVEGFGDWRPQPGVVQRHHVYPDAVWVYVSGGGDGLVEP